VSRSRRQQDWKYIQTVVEIDKKLALIYHLRQVTVRCCLGLISYTVVKIASGKVREVNALVWILTILFILRYVYLVTARNLSRLLGCGFVWKPDSFGLALNSRGQMNEASA
jgi:hypothetical protein